MPSAAGEIDTPDIARRQFVVSAAVGAAAVPFLRLDGLLADNWNPQLVRPPGALGEADFLSRCIKCGQCMRICPTNVIHPAGLQAGLEGLWTPVLNFRIGTSGCQYKCVACGNICPTAAIRPIRLEERLGKGGYALQGPLRIGTAFVERGRCLPWAMDIPCIVCQENCPVSPKAIETREVFAPVSTAGPLTVSEAAGDSVVLAAPVLSPSRFETGDYFCRPAGRTEEPLQRILGNSAQQIMIAAERPWALPPAAGQALEIRIRLQQPVVRPELCIGCGVCEHECPVRGRRAIRVTAENESRHAKHKMILNQR
jgi:ferredoxin